MSTDETYRWTVHDAHTVYDGTPWLHVAMVELTAPSGETIQHARVRIPDAAIALVVDEPRQRVLMLHRHRWVPTVSASNCSAA